MVAKDKTSVPAITVAAGLAGRTIARLEAQAAKVHAEANGAVSSKEGFSAVIKRGKTLIEIQDDSFAVRQTAEGE